MALYVFSPQYFSTGGASPTGINTVFTDPEVRPGTYTIIVQVNDAYVCGTPIPRTFKERNQYLREQGMPYAAISANLDIPINTI